MGSSTKNSRLRILFISQYFHPEVGAAAARIGDLAKDLVKQGHEVTVVAEFPNYPTGVLNPEYRKRIYRKEQYEGIRTIRTFVIASERRTFYQRMLFYLSFMFSSIIGVLLAPKCDVLIATSPPLFVGLSGYVASRIKGCRFVLDVRDLWPESAIILGELKNKLLIKLSQKLESYLYSKADRITIAVPGFRNKIGLKSKALSKIVEVTNGVDAEVFSPQENSYQLKEKFGLNGKYVVLFSGNHGLAQGLPSVIRTAELLRERRDIIFLFIGEGVEKKRLVKMKEDLKLESVVFLGEQARKDMPTFINMSDICIVPLKGEKLFQNALPSKMYEYMACAKPIILSIEGEAVNLLKEADAGIAVEPEDSEQMIKAIIKLLSDFELSRKYGENGRLYVMRNYSRYQITVKLESMLKEFVI